MNAEVIAIGDELLIGQVVNTNAAWLGEQFTAMGATLRRVTTVGDDRQTIIDEVGAARRRAEVVIVTGGLGPTHDDITKEAVASLFGVELAFHQDLFDALKARYDRAGRKMSASNRTQAEVPVGFTVLPNRWGSAPGLLHEDGCFLVLLPGVPSEMKGLMEAEVFPRLRATGELSPALRTTLLTTGVAESRLHDDVGDISAWLEAGCSLAYLPSIHGVRVRVTAPDQGQLASLCAHVRAKAGKHVFGEGDDLLEAVVGELLVVRKWTVGTAESATGGLVSSRLTDIPGASRYVLGGIVAYENAVKRDVLGVPEEYFKDHGAVSREVVERMASGVRRALGTDVGLATSGVMGPGGGSEEKPVGTLWIAVQTPRQARSLKIVMRHDRMENKARGATTALDFLRRCLLK